MPMPWEMSILDGALSTWLTANMTVVGDLDVSGEIIGGTIPIENLSNVDKQSFENLIDNGNYKIWTAGDSSAPDTWVLGGAGASIAKNSSAKIGDYCVALTRGGTDCNVRTSVVDFNRYKSRVVTAGQWVKASTASQALILFSDGVSGSIVSDFHSGGGGWEWLTVTFTVAAGATKLDFQSRVHTTDGTVYFDGAIVVEGPICPAFSPKPLTDTHTYGEMYIFNNSNATVIETANTPIALRQISGGLQKGFIFDAGSTGGITGYADNSGSVAGTVLVLCAANHNLATGDIITIRGTTNYNGIFEVVVTGADQLYITDTWVANDGASDWDQGSSLTAQAGAAGVYTSTWQMTTAPAGACELCFMVNINETPQDKSTACRDMAINDKDNNSSTCLLTIAEDDVIWLSVESDSTADITNSMGNINLERIS